MKQFITIFVLILIYLFFTPLIDGTLAHAACCPSATDPNRSCCVGSPEREYTYDCTCCGSCPDGSCCPASGKCCMHVYADSCGCPTATGCSGDQCACSVGACGGDDDDDDDDDDCSQPCGGCFDCGVCASTASLPENTLLMLSFSEAKFGEVSDEEISRCQQSRNPG